jgi:hypothetical protein
MTQGASLCLASGRRNPNVGALHGRLASLEELKVRQTEWIHGILFTFTFDNPVSLIARFRKSSSQISSRCFLFKL